MDPSQNVQGSGVAAGKLAPTRADIVACKTVCLALGPYRNMTTLTAATLFLHPHCQVLNHGGGRIFDTDADFLSSYSREKMDRFIEVAIGISSGGARGDSGGSITLSHAFDADHKMRDVFESTGLGLVKETITCLFWKESLATSRLIRARNVDLAAIFSKEERLRFLMPIRNPLDCATSNLATGHVERFGGLTRNSPLLAVTEAVLEEIQWFSVLREAFPDRFFCFFEHQMGPGLIRDLGVFLGLPQDEHWVSNAQSVMVSKSHYAYDAAMRDAYREAVERKFTAFPEMKASLLRFNA